MNPVPAFHQMQRRPVHRRLSCRAPTDGMHWQPFASSLPCSIANASTSARFGISMLKLIGLLYAFLPFFVDAAQICELAPSSDSPSAWKMLAPGDLPSNTQLPLSPSKLVHCDSHHPSSPSPPAATTPISSALPPSSSPSTPLLIPQSHSHRIRPSVTAGMCDINDRQQVRKPRQHHPAHFFD
jgi:hypothetical protein